VIVAIVAIIRRLLEGAPKPPTESPSATKPPKPTETPEPSESPEVSPTGPTGAATGPTSLVTGPTGPTRLTAPTGPTGPAGATGPGPSENEAAQEIMEAAVSSSSQDPWVWIVVLAVLVGIGWFVWSSIRRRRSGSPPADEPTSPTDGDASPSG